MPEIIEEEPPLVVLMKPSDLKVWKVKDIGREIRVEGYVDDANDVNDVDTSGKIKRMGMVVEACFRWRIYTRRGRMCSC